MKNNKKLWKIAIAMVIVLMCVCSCSKRVKSSDKVIMVKIPGGTFTMGNDYDSYSMPAHQVTVSSFKMSKTEITQKQYEKILKWAKKNGKVKAKYPNIVNTNSDPSFYSKYDIPKDESQDNLPVEEVTWYDAVMFCNLLTMREMKTSDCVYTITDQPNSSLLTVAMDMSKKGYRLPTEAEWEYAARGGENYEYAGSDDIEEVAWYWGNSGHRTHEVGQKRANGYGLYDMIGNVAEWCWDCYGSYSADKQTNPTGPSEGLSRVQRGGGQRNSVKDCAVYSRYLNTLPHSHDNGVGFRVVRKD